MPRGMSLVKSTEHPHALPSKVQTPHKGKGSLTPSSDSSKVLRENTFWLVPEFLPPVVPDEESSAVAAQDSTEETKDGDKAPKDSTEPVPPDGVAWIYGAGNKPETMHPFWACRRLTEEQQSKEVSDVIKHNKAATSQVPAKRVPIKNLETMELAHNVVHLATTHSVELCGFSKLIFMTFITNSTDLKKGDELILKITLSQQSKNKVSDATKSLNCPAPKTARR